MPGTDKYQEDLAQDNNFEDRRIFARFSVKISLRYLDLNLRKKQKGESHDMSANGIGLYTEDELSPHTQLDLWLHVPDGQPLNVKGEVVWIRAVGSGKYRAGIKLEQPELMRMSRALCASKPEEIAEKPDKSNNGLFKAYLSILRFINAES